MTGCALLLAASLCASARAEPWPKLTQSQSAYCAEALSMAQTAFHATEESLHPTPAKAGNAASRLVVHPIASRDLSGGNALVADETVFAKIPQDGEDAGRSLYWQRDARNGWRLALVESSRGWRGDVYSLHAIAADVRPERLLAAARSVEQPVAFVPTLEHQWWPPLILQHQKTQQLWVIEFGHPAEFLAPWRVHVLEDSGLQSRCVLQFRPAVKSPLQLLPPEVRRLATLLDKALGRGEDEGTLQPTAWLRVRASRTWANVALRPWVEGRPYNTREEVDGGLQQWSRQGRAHRQAHQEIQRQIPLAESALTRYYGQTFGLAPDLAASMASYAIDMGLRSQFTFHTDAPDRFDQDRRARPNPWPKP